MLANPKADDANYPAIRNPTPHSPDSVGKSENGAGELTAIIATFSLCLQPWPIDVCLKVAHLSAMAATICKSSDYSSEGWQVRKRTPPLARERHNLRSESDVFYRLLFGRIAPLASQSARHARILDRAGRSGPPALISAGPKVGLRIWQKNIEIHA